MDSSFRCEGYLKNLCTCKSCFRKLVEPFTLECGDILCRYCVNNFVTETCDHITCPVCGQKMPGSKVTPNSHIEKLVRILDEATALYGFIKKHPFCDEHETVPATHFCYNCSYSLCKNCAKVHERSTAAEPHVCTETGSIDEDTNVSDVLLVRGKDLEFCDVHPSRTVTLWCLVCDCPVCEQCSLLEHKGHTHEYLSKITEHTDGELNQIKTQAEKYTREQAFEKEKLFQEESILKTELAHCTNKINKWHIEVFRDLERKKGYLLNNFRLKTRTREQELGNHCVELFEKRSLHLNALLERCKLIDSIPYFGNSMDIIREHDSIQHMWNQLKVPGAYERPVKHVNIHFRRTESVLHCLHEVPYGDIQITPGRNEMKLGNSLSAQVDCDVPCLYKQTSSFDSRVRITSMRVLDRETLVVVSHSSTKCIRFSFEGKMIWEFRDKLIGPYDVISRNIKKGLYLLVSDPGELSNETPGFIRLYKERKNSVLFDRNCIKDTYPRGLAICESTLFVCNVKDSVIESYGIGQSFECRLLKKYTLRENMKSPIYVDPVCEGRFVVTSLELGVDLVEMNDDNVCSSHVVDYTEHFMPSNCVCGHGETLFVGNKIFPQLMVKSLKDVNKEFISEIDTAHGPISTVTYDNQNTTIWVALKDGTVTQLCRQ